MINLEALFWSMSGVCVALAVTNEVDVVVLAVESVAVTTCNTLPPVPAGSVTVLPVQCWVNL